MITSGPSKPPTPVLLSSQTCTDWCYKRGCFTEEDRTRDSFPDVLQPPYFWNFLHPVVICLGSSTHTYLVMISLKKRPLPERVRVQFVSVLSIGFVNTTSALNSRFTWLSPDTCNTNTNTLLQQTSSQNKVWNYSNNMFWYLDFKDEFYKVQKFQVLQGTLRLVSWCF